MEHPGHDHPLVLRESLQDAGGYGGGRHRVYCDGCKEPISSSSSSSGTKGGGGAFYACPNSDCWFLLHKRCAELPPKIEHPCHPEHALTLHPFLLYHNRCDVCRSEINGFTYRCFNCDFDVHLRCASMALHIQDRVDENSKIHQHSLIPIEMEVQFLCTACGREHKGKSYLCPTCGFWANQICASAPTTFDLHSHDHPLTLFRPASRYYEDCCSDGYCSEDCEICDEEVEKACWAYFCEKCEYSVHLGCLPLEEAKNPNKDIQTNFHSDSTSCKIEIPTDPKEEIIPITWPVQDESVELITQMIKNLSLQKRHKRATKINRCRKDHPLIFVNKKIAESKDDQVCDGCVQIISFQFYHCAPCNFSLHEWCAELPNKLQHIFHPQHSLDLFTQQSENIIHYCYSCGLLTNGFVFGCLTCGVYLDLKCASLPRLIKHQVHDHDLALRRTARSDSCYGCGLLISTSFGCEACNFRLCINRALLPFSARHRYDKHPFALTYSPIKGQPDEYYCEICEEDIKSMYWFYHCIKCDQSLHPNCIYHIERSKIVKFGVRLEVNFHSHLLNFVRCPKAKILVPCHYSLCYLDEAVNDTAYECEQCDFWMHGHCLYTKAYELTTSMTPPN